MIARVLTVCSGGGAEEKRAGLHTCGGPRGVSQVQFQGASSRGGLIFLANRLCHVRSTMTKERSTAIGYKN